MGNASSTEETEVRADIARPLPTTGTFAERAEAIDAERDRAFDYLKAVNAMARPTADDYSRFAHRMDELEAATERLRREFYPRAHELIVGLGMASTFSKTGRSTRVVWRREAAA